MYQKDVKMGPEYKKSQLDTRGCTIRFTVEVHLVFELVRAKFN